MDPAKVLLEPLAYYQRKVGFDDLNSVVNQVNLENQIKNGKLRMEITKNLDFLC